MIMNALRFPLRLLTATAIVIGSVMCAVWAAVPPSAPPSVTATAGKDLPIYLAKCLSMIHDRSSFNLAATDDISRAVLLDPVSVRTYVGDSTVTTATLETVSRDAGRWCVPVSLDGRVRFFINISSTAKGYIRSAAGFASLASEYGAIAAAWPHHRIILVSVSNTGRYFFSVADLPTDNLTPILRDDERGGMLLRPGFSTPPVQDYSHLATVNDAVTRAKSEISKVGGAQ